MTILSLLGVGTGGGEASLFSYWWDGIIVGNLDSSADWQELSGLTAPTLPANAAYMWGVSDSPANKLFCLSLADASNQGIWALSGTAPSDIEEITSARIGGQSYLYVCDIGDNGNARATFNIYRVKEPTITGSDGTVAAGDIETIVCEYPAGNLPTHKDAEGVFADPDTGDLYIMTKREAIPKVYRLSHAASYAGTQTLTYMGEMFDIPDTTTVPLGATNCNVVGACINPLGTEILVKNYDKMYLFARDKATQTIYEALQATPVEVDGYVGGGSNSPKKSHPHAEPQGEAVSFDYTGTDYYTASEYLASEGSTAARFPLYRYVRATGVPVTVSFQDGVSPTAGYTGTSDTTIWDTNPATNYGADPTITCDKAVGVETDQRKGLLKFDLGPGNIPPTATVIGARVDLYIAAEGQGWTFHQMLVDWNEASTYNSLTGGVTPDDVEASLVEDCRNGVNLDTILNVTVRNNVFRPSYYLVPSVSGWVLGLYGNYGWLILGTDTGGDGVQFASKQAVTASQRPKLTIRYLP